MDEVDVISFEEPPKKRFTVYVQSANQKFPMEQSDESRPLFGGEFTDKPLFGDSNRKERVINLLVGGVTAILLIVTVLSSFFARTPIHGLNIYFAFCILLIFLSHMLLIIWYRQGDLDPKFRLMIYYNSLTMVLLNTCALSIFFSEK